MVAAGAAASALIWGIAAATGVLAITVLIHPWLGRDSDPRRAPALIELFVVTTILLWRVRHVLSRDRVALWLEEKRELDARVANEDLIGVALVALRRKLTPAFVALLLMAALLYVSPAVNGGRLG